MQLMERDALGLEMYLSVVRIGSYFVSSIHC